MTRHVLATLCALALVEPSSSAVGAVAADEVVSLGFEALTPVPQPSLSVDGEIRIGAGFASMPGNASAVLYGGQAGVGTLAKADTWVWDGATWTPKCGSSGLPSCRPGPRAMAGLATSPAGVLLYGGTDTGPDGDDFHIRGDTQIFDGEEWTTLCVSCPPGRRIAAAVGGNGIEVLLFGGFAGDDVPLANDTWRFDGSDWERVHPGGADAPPLVVGASLAWDGAQFILFGGGVVTRDEGGPRGTSATWAWRDGTWTKLCGDPDDPCGPSDRLFAGLSFLDSEDASRRGALLLGGLLAFGADDDSEEGGEGDCCGGSCCGDGGGDGGGGKVPDGGGGGVKSLAARAAAAGSIAQDGDDGSGFPRDAWFWNGTRWIALGTPWFAAPLDEAALSHPPDFPILPATAARAQSCQVSLVGAFPQAGPPPTLATETWSVGFDADRDGLPDPCPGAPEPHRPVVGVAYDAHATPLPRFSLTGADVRIFSAFAALPDGDRALLYGGVFLDDDPLGPAQSDTWIWDGSAWSAACGGASAGAPARCAPGSRALHGLATAPSGALLYGGIPVLQTGAGLVGPQADAFLWNGHEWIEVCASCAPGPRLGAALAGNGEMVLLFGGMTGEPALANDTWAFDGATWTQLSAGGSDAPEPRLGAQLAWDGTQFVLFSGLGIAGGLDGAKYSVGADTWTWNAPERRWVEICGKEIPCGPSERAVAGFSYLASPDADLRGAVLTAGIDWVGQETPLGDAWLWDGAGWLPLASPWVKRAYDIPGHPPRLPLGIVSASLPDACHVTVTALEPTTSGDFGLEHKTWNVGFDAEGDGVPDPCPDAPAPTPSLTPAPERTPRAGATPAPSRQPSATPTASQSGERIPVTSRGRRIPTQP